MASPTRKAWPGFIFRSVSMPLRLFNRPITATRSGMGVVPGAGATSGCGMSTVTTSGSVFCCWEGGMVERWQDASNKAAVARAKQAGLARINRESRPGNRRSPQRGARRDRASRMGGRPLAYPSDSVWAP